MLSFLYVYSDHSILECYNLFSGVELSMRSFFVIPYPTQEWHAECSNVQDCTFNVQGIFNIHSRFIQCPFKIYSMFIQDSFNIHSRFIQCLFKTHSGFIQDLYS